MIDLENLRLADILPERLKTREILAIANALDGQLKEITKSIFDIVIMPRIDEMPEDIVDNLAWQLHVDFYEPLGLDLDKKRALVKNSIVWHRHKGTKYALESIIRTLFLTDFKIEEWFEYGGEPYFFRIVSRDALREKEQYNDLIRAVHELKNERSWLESLTFHQEAEASLHMGVVGRHTSRFEVNGAAPGTKTYDATIRFGMAGRHTSTFEVDGALP